MKKILTLLALLLFGVSAYSQTFEIDNYRNFLKNNQDMSVSRLVGMHPYGLFRGDVLQSDQPLFFDSLTHKLGFSEFEKETLLDQKFIVSGRDQFERAEMASVGHLLAKIWHDDLPVFINSDLLLHAFHMSYDAILKDIEQTVIIGRLEEALEQMRDRLPKLRAQYEENTVILDAVNDMDIYFTIALDLLVEEDIRPVFEENKAEITKLMQYIETEKPACYPLFSSTSRTIDFSQFTPRGHYTDTEKLERYFKSMIWLGRTEFYLIAPESDDSQKQKPEDIRRQIIASVLITNLAYESGAIEKLTEIDEIILAMVGESDNVKIEHIKELTEETGLSSPLQLTRLEECERFKEALANKPYAGQKILSQILMSDPMDLEQIKPSSAFMLMGQRFVIDSYVFSNVVYDRIIFNNKKVLRMMPSSLDVLFALGNNAAADLLKPEFERYPYMTNLASLRYLIDSYGEDFWSSSMYNGWLDMIRSLNPPDQASRGKFPEFMQTPAWWQSKMNTQLASWAQLRHDNLLYAKQSYTGGVSCSFPHIFVEPVPEFFASLKRIGETSLNRLGGFLQQSPDDQSPEKYLKERIKDYFDKLIVTGDTLETIAFKELSGEPLNDSEGRFLESFFYEDGMCGIFANGWYPRLFYIMDDITKADFIVADVHTQPTDEAGNPVGKVLHVGTGPFNIGAVITENEKGEATTYAGVFMSYYEHISLNFDRLTDERWEEAFKAFNPPGIEPELIDIYKSDTKGTARSADPVSLPTFVTGVEDDPQPHLKAEAFPNPFATSTIITFSVPFDAVEADVNAGIYDISGNLIKLVYQGKLPSRNYSVEWNGTDETGNPVASGTYLYRIEINATTTGGQIILAK